MKKILNVSKYTFNPANKTVDFSLIPDFSLNRLYGIVNVTQNALIYAPGASGLGVSSVQGDVVTLQYDTTSHKTTDVLNIYYETTDASFENNSTLEMGGNLQDSSEKLSSILIELKLMNTLLFQIGAGYNMNSIGFNLDALRKDMAFSILNDPTQN